MYSVYSFPILIAFILYLENPNNKNPTLHEKGIYMYVYVYMYMHNSIIIQEYYKTGHCKQRFKIVMVNNTPNHVMPLGVLKQKKF